MHSKSAIVAVCLAAPLAAAAPEGLSSQDLLARFCVGCHSDATRTAGFSLEGLDPRSPSQHPQVWEKVLRKMASGEMPPPGAPAPEQSSRAGFLRALEAALDAEAAARPNPGRTPARRLNRAEYSNAVRDLLALDIDFASMLPVDDSGYGFDTIAEVLTLSPALLDRYLFAARRISRLAVGLGPSKATKEIFVRDRETGFRRAGHGRPYRTALPLGAERGAAFRYYFPLAGTYRIRAAVDRGDSRAANEHVEASLAVEAGLRTVSVAFLAESSKPERTRPEGDGPEAPQPPLELRLDGVRWKLVDLPRGASPFRVRRVSVEGPFQPSGPGCTPSRRRIFQCRPESAGEERPCAERILADLARQAYRRPVTKADLQPLLAMYESGRSEGGFENGVARALEALLVAPGFLFRIERDPPGAVPGTAYPASDIELASRLAFFLWSSLPDDELLSAAEAGRLRMPGELERQARRMLADRRAGALAENFAGQWLELRKLDGAQPDRRLFPGFDAELRFAMRRETELLVEDILRNNRSVLELLEADWSFLNSRLAEHYGIHSVHGPQLRPVRLRDERRGGILGHGSILTVTSYPNRTSVVIRGKWVLENLFGMPPPPPPPGIPELEEERAAGVARTLRERMALHSQDATCASCHVRMDPIGFALENYDAVGRWRETDGGAPIDASGELPGGVEFDGPAQLKRALSVSLKDQFASTLIEKLLTYALGRGLEYYDRPTVRLLARGARDSGYRLADMVVGVAGSMPFQMRRSSEQ